MFFSKLARGDEDGNSGVSLKREDVILISSVVRSIKRFKDAVDTNITKVHYPIVLFYKSELSVILDS